MTYSICVELADGTLCNPFVAYRTKRTALQTARHYAKINSDAFAVAYVVSHDTMTVERFPARKWIEGGVSGPSLSQA